MKNILIFDDATNKILAISKNKNNTEVSNSLCNVLYSQDKGNSTMEFKPISANKFDILVNMLENSTTQV
ncbi:hypothetical protein [Megamonas hypermegale]|uniref:hypothetical protein n=1 Tax=Megamonas hypermegale TaxID=158847 RepID=UPI00320B6E6E